MNRKILLTLSFATLSATSATFASNIREFQTTRLNSTAGAGVASILSTEAAVLNPATSMFFEGNSASYQSYTTSLQHKNTLRETNNDSFAKQNRSQGLFITDSSSGVKGGVAYLKQKENRYERDKVVLHGAGSIGAKTSLGLSYSYVQDKLPRSKRDRHQSHHQLGVGLLHVVDEATTLGLVVTDPTRTNPGEERALAGIQYQVASRIVVLGDLGAQYTRSFSKHYLWRAAVQLKLFEDFFVRAGKFQEALSESKGTGWGASWVGPRFGVEFAQKISEYYGKDGYVYKDEKLVDTSLSAIIKF